MRSTPRQIFENQFVCNLFVNSSFGNEQVASIAVCVRVFFFLFRVYCLTSIRLKCVNETFALVNEHLLKTCFVHKITSCFHRFIVVQTWLQLVRERNALPFPIQRQNDWPLVNAKPFFVFFGFNCFETKMPARARVHYHLWDRIQFQSGRSQ